MLADRTDLHDAWMAVLWNLDDFKRSQSRDIEAGDWVLPPRPDVSFSSEATARKAFQEAMDAWDDQAADRAVTGLLPFYRNLDALFELMWVHGARCFANIGHKIIWVTQLERALKRFGGRNAEPVLRSMVHGLLYWEGRDKTDRYRQSRDQAHLLPAGWLTGKEDPGQSRVLAAALRKSDEAGARRLVIDAFRDGLGPETVWDGLRMHAAEVFSRRILTPSSGSREQLLPVHNVTVNNGFVYAFDKTRSEPLKRELILTAATYQVALRTWLKANVGLNDPVQERVTGVPASLNAQMEKASPATVRAWLNAAGKTRMKPYLDRLTHNLLYKGTEHHMHKYAAAMFEDTALAHPSLAADLAAPAITYLKEKDRDTNLAGRCKKLLAKT